MFESEAATLTAISNPLKIHAQPINRTSKKGMGIPGERVGETKDIPDEPDDSTPTYSLQCLGVVGLATDSSSPTGWLVVLEVGAED